MNILMNIRRGTQDGILVVGNHAGIVQSILDFDFLCNKKVPSVMGIVTGSRKAQKFFFGTKEILVPCYKDFASIPAEVATHIQWMLNLQSGRRAFESTSAFFTVFPHALGGHIFAEQVPELHATELIKRFGTTKLLVGPSGVGLLVPGYLKLGAVGGITPDQIAQGRLTTPGSVAIISTSGGMANELISAVAGAGKGVSFVLSIGGDRFPVLSLGDALLLAESDKQTKAVIYFGELGGVDEYEIVTLLEEKRITKPIFAHISGVIDEAFDEHVQFGHAKALVKSLNESALAKRKALARVGVVVPKTFSQFLQAIAELPGTIKVMKPHTDPLSKRSKSILSTRRILSLDAAPVFVKKGKLLKPTSYSFAALVLQALLGRSFSATTVAFTENIFELLIDHGGAVSGAVNTMVTARAGRDLVTSLSAGLLTIGPRFGGAINEAALAWIEAVKSGQSGSEYVALQARKGSLIAGIGHAKYRVGIPDPRVKELAKFADLLKKHPHYDFARSVESVTTTKSGSLILNIDGIIAALFLDIVRECDKFSTEDLRELVTVEFFNALFVIPRSVGFIAHFMEQKKNDEGLFRLPDDLLFEHD